MMRSTLLMAAFATLSLLSAGVPAGSSMGVSAGCGHVTDIRDPDLRARFASFEQTQSASAAKVCAMFRNEMSAAIDPENR